MNASKRGFTLLELLIAVTIFAAIAAALAVTFRTAADAMARGEEEAVASARLRAAVDAATRALRGADPAPLPGEKQPQAYFIGEPAGLRFLSSSPLTAAPGRAFRLLALFAAEPRGSESPGGMAVVHAGPFRPGGAYLWDGSGEAQLLLPGATDLVFSYSPGPTPEGSYEWRETWDAREDGALPAAVRVSFATRGEDGPLRTSFVVVLPAGGRHGS